MIVISDCDQWSWLVIVRNVKTGNDEILTWAKILTEWVYSCIYAAVSLEINQEIKESQSRRTVDLSGGFGNTLIDLNYKNTKIWNHNKYIHILNARAIAL